MLKVRKASSRGDGWVFSDCPKPLLNSSLDHAHNGHRRSLKMTDEFVLHSLRHTYGTRLGEAGADAFTIMRLMGHSSVAVSQRYVHPTPEAIGRAVQHLDALNAKAAKELARRMGRPAPTTIFTTVVPTPSVSH